MSLIRGRSDVSDLDTMARIVQCALFGLNCWAYFEWIESKSNWSDEISRIGARGQFARRRGFRIYGSRPVLALWRLPLVALTRVFSFI